MSAPVLRGENADLFPDEIPASGFVFDHSPGAKAQRFLLLEALRVSPVNTFMARDDLGILMPAARVFELKALDYSIETNKVDVPDAKGVMRFGIACYVLTGEPDGVLNEK